MSTKILFEEEIKEFLNNQMLEVEKHQEELMNTQFGSINVDNVVKRTVELGQIAGIIQGKLEMIKNFQQFLSTK